MSTSKATISRIIRKVRGKSWQDIAAWVRWRINDIASYTFYLTPVTARLPTYRSFSPDSFWIYGAHAHVRELFQRFTASNLNNRGDRTRFNAFVLNLEQILKEGIPGDFAELGVWRGNSSAVLAHYAMADGRRTLLFDAFEGFNTRDLTGVDSDQRKSFSNTSLNLVKKIIGDSTLVEYVVGYFPETVSDSHKERIFAAVSLDCDLYAPMKAGLEFFYPRLSPGGLLMLHDYSSGCWDGARDAIDEFCATTGCYVILQPDKSGSAFIRKH